MIGLEKIAVRNSKTGQSNIYYHQIVDPQLIRTHIDLKHKIYEIN